MRACRGVGLKIKLIAGVCIITAVFANNYLYNFRRIYRKKCGGMRQPARFAGGVFQPIIGGFYGCFSASAARGVT